VLIPAHTSRARENVKVSDDLITNEVRKWRTHDVPEPPFCTLYLLVRSTG